MDKRKNPPRRSAGVKRARPAVTPLSSAAPTDAIAHSLHGSDGHAQHPPVPEILAAESGPPLDAGEAIQPEDVSQLALRTAIEANHAAALGRHRTPVDGQQNRDGMPHPQDAAASPVQPEPGSRGAPIADAGAELLKLQASMLDLYRDAAVSSMTFWTDLMISRWPKPSAGRGAQR